MDNTLKLRVMFDTIDRMTRPLKTIIGGNRDLSKSLKESRSELSKLQKQQKDVSGYRVAREELGKSATRLKEARERMRALQQQIQSGDAPTTRMRNALNAASREVVKLTEHERAHNARLLELRTRMQDAGRGVKTLASYESGLKKRIDGTNASIREQDRRLQELKTREARIAQARERRDKVQGVVASMAIGGYAARGTGLHMLNELRETLVESKKAENETLRIRALGLGDKATADAVRFARAHREYGTSETDRMTLMRDAMTIFADEHHAQMVLPTLSKMKLANEATFGAEDAHENEEKFMNMLKVIELRGGTRSEAAFKDEANMVQKVLTATGGRVGGDEWRNFIQTGGVAAKQMRKDAFYYQMEPLIQEMGGKSVGTGLMSAYSGIYQGKTTVRAAKQMMALNLLDPKKVEYNKIGMIKQIRPGALAGGDLFKASPLEWMEKVLLPKLAAKGITDPDKVKDMIGTIFTNRTAANLFTTMYMQRDQIHKNEKLNTGADDIDALHAKAVQSTQGREIEALAKARDLKKEIGERVSPMYNAALEKTSQAMGRLLGFMDKHRTASMVIITTLTVLAGVLAVAGTLTIALAAVLGPLAMLRFSLTVLGVKSGLLFPVLGKLVGALSGVGRVFVLLGRLALANPVFAAVMLLALAALYVWHHWDTLGPKFTRLWQGIKAVFGAAAESISEKWGATLSWFNNAPRRFGEIGSNLIDGLVRGINNRIGAVRDAITSVADSTVGWFKEKLGIHSPSVVFGELGGFISEGAALGMQGGQGKVARAAAGLAVAAVTSFGTPALGTTAQFIKPSDLPIVRSTVPIDTRPPLSSNSPAAVDAVASGPITINIYPAAGADPAAIAKAVRAELDRREREKLSRIGSRLSDAAG